MFYLKSYLYLMFAAFILLQFSCKPAEFTTAEISQVASCAASRKVGNRNVQLYNIAINNNKIAYYQGIEGVTKIGNFKKLLDKSTYEKIIAALQKSGVRRNAVSNREDGNSYIFTLVLPDRNPVEENLSVSEISALAKLFDSLQNSKDWLPLDDKTLKDTPQELDNQLIVQLNNGVDINVWLKKYEKNELKIKKRLSPDLNYWLLDVGNNFGKPNFFLETVKSDKEVVMVQFNKKLTLRK